MSIKRKLIIGFTITILSSLILVSLVSLLGINNRFENYLQSEQMTKFKALSDEIGEIYIKNNYDLTGLSFEQTAIREGIELTIFDRTGNIEYTTGAPRTSGMGRGMMRRPQQNTIIKNISFDILDTNTKVGSVSISFYDYSYITESASVFIQTLQRSILFAGVIALIIGILISLLISRNISNPLLHLKNKSLEITKGNLEPISIKSSNIKEIDELSNSIEYLRTELINQERIRKEYAQNISHDLRTPLTTLKSYLEAMEDGVYEPTSEYLLLLKDEIDRVTKMVDGLKSSYNLTNTQLSLKLSNFNLKEELNNIKLTYENLFKREDKFFEVSIAEEIIVTMDRGKLREAIVNLLDNSRKNTKSGDNILIRSWSSNNKLYISVEDNGYGIPEKDLPYVTERLYRSDHSRNRETGGSGLGLSLVDSVVKSHNGSLKIESIEGSGTKVTMIFNNPPKI